MFIPTKRGKSLLLHNGYTYSLMTGGNYYCSRKLTMKCGAKIKLDKNNVIVNVKETHNHGRPNIFKTKDGPVFFPTKRGHKLLLYNGYTYSCSNNMYYCSRRIVKKCTARVKLDARNRVVRAQETHNHEPPIFHISKNGETVVHSFTTRQE